MFMQKQRELWKIHKPASNTQKTVYMNKKFDLQEIYF